MQHSKQETFFWLEAAALLDRVEVPKLVANADPKQVEDFSRVRQSVDVAEAILMCLARREVSIDELDRKENEEGGMWFGKLQINLKKKALAYVASTGNTEDRIVSYAVKKGIITNEDVIRARKRKRLPEWDGERIDIVPRFLVEFWCGEKGAAGAVHTRKRGVRLELVHKFSCFEKDGKTVSRTQQGAKFHRYQWPRQSLFIPPLCFFTYKALAAFVTISLNLETSEQSIRKWVNRLSLERPRPLTAPKITQVQKLADGLQFHSSSATVSPSHLKT